MVEVATVDELRENLDKYLQMVDDGSEVLLIKNGRNLGRILPKTSGESIVNSLIGFLKSGVETPLTDSLVGIVKGNYDLEREKDEYFREKYSLAD